MQRYLKNLLLGKMDSKEEEETNVTSSCPNNEDVCDDDCSGTNGLLLSNVIIPEEVIANILSFLAWRELLPCRMVCQTWKEIVDSSVRHEKMKIIDFSKIVSSSNDISSRVGLYSFGHLPFYVNYNIGTKFGKNLLKNPYGNVGANKFDSWEIVHSGGDGWEVEVPAGCDPLPKSVEGTSCFVTSYRWGYKQQMINLHSCGFNSKMMDEIQPDIKISEWYAARFDCGSKYRIMVQLLDAKRKLVAEFKDEKRIQLGIVEWNEVSYTFSDYGPGVRYILFYHGGCDTQFWAGFYGSKMTGGKVIALVPQRLLRTSSGEDESNANPIS